MDGLGVGGCIERVFEGTTGGEGETRKLNGSQKKKNNRNPQSVISGNKYER
jgi:hypothetical protein